MTGSDSSGSSGFLHRIILQLRTLRTGFGAETTEDAAVLVKDEAGLRRPLRLGAVAPETLQRTALQEKSRANARTIFSGGPSYRKNQSP